MKDFMDGKESYHKCSWESIKTQFATGDYVIIALGTNDTSQISAYNQNPEKGYSAEQFKNWYKEIAADVKAKGAPLSFLHLRRLLILLKMVSLSVQTNGRLHRLSLSFVTR